MVAAVEALEPGELVTFNDIADQIGRPGSGQAVANVLRGAPDLPWWRVLPSDGRVYRNLASEQVPLLRAEGHHVDEHRNVRPAPPRARVSSGNPMEGVVGYSRAVRVGDQVHVAGTCAVWPDGSVDPDAGVQARRALEIIGEALAEVGASFADVVRTRLYLVDAADLEAVAAAHGDVFGDVRPACTGVVVAALLDERWKVEIEADAILR